MTQASSYLFLYKYNSKWQLKGKLGHVVQISAAFVVKNLLDSKTRTTSSTRFPHKVMHARESASIWRENVVAVVILLRFWGTLETWFHSSKGGGGCPAVLEKTRFGWGCLVSRAYEPPFEQWNLAISEFLRECRSGGNKLSNVRRFINLRSGEGLSSFYKDNGANFSG